MCGRPMSETKISDEAVLVRFFRVQPGEEEAVADRLAKRFPEALVYRVFGTTDFAVVESRRDWDVSEPLSDQDDGFRVFDVMPVRCFCWQDGLDWNGLANGTHGLVAFSFVKINEDPLRRDGILAEREMITRLKELAREEEHSGVAVHALSTLGWHELLVMITGGNLGAILSYVLQMRSGFGRHDRPVSNVQSTTTVVGLRWPAIPQRPTSFGGVRVTLHVSCSPEADQKVHSDIEAAFGPRVDRAVWSFGVNDFLKVLDGLEDPVDYMKKVSDLRKTNSGFIYRTVSLLGGAPPESPGPPDPTKNPMPGLPFVVPSLADSRVRQLERENFALAAMLLDTYAMLHSYSRDPQIWEAFQDVWTYAERLRDAVVDAGPTPEEDPLRDWSNLSLYLELLSYAIRQRALGTGVLWEREVATYPYPHRFGGVHRLLTALAAVPQHVLGPGDQHSGSLAVAGFTGDFERFRWAAFNVPWQALEDLSGWSALVHEAGHQYATHVDLIGSESVQRVIRATGLRNTAGLLLLVEVFCEVFGCVLLRGSRGWDTYLRDSLDYIRGQPALQEPRTLLTMFNRFLLADLFFSWKQKGATGVHRPSPRNAQERAREIASLLGASLDKVERPDWRSEIKKAVVRALELRSAGLFEALNEHLPKHDAGVGDVAHLTNRLRAGKVLLSPMVEGTPVNPLSILRAALDLAGDREWKQIVVSLLSLWHYAKTRQPIQVAR